MKVTRVRYFKRLMTSEAYLWAEAHRMIHKNRKNLLMRAFNKARKLLA